MNFFFSDHSFELSSHSDIDVLRAGTYHSSRYGKFTVKPSDFSEFIAEFDESKAAGKRQIDVDHKGSQGDTRAAGWIQSMYVEGDKLRAKVEWTPYGESIIKNKEYKFTSAEYQDKYPNKETGEMVGKRRMKAVTLTNRPFIEGMQEVTLMDDDNVIMFADEENLTRLSTATIGGRKKQQPNKTQYAFVDADGQGHLPYLNADGSVDMTSAKTSLVNLNNLTTISDTDRESVRGKLEAALERGGAPSGNDNDNTRKHMSEIHTLLGLSEDADEATMLGAVRVLVEKKEPGDDYVSLAEFNEMKAGAEATGREFGEFKRDTYLAEMVSEGYITPAEIKEGSIVVLFDANPEAARKMIESRPKVTQLSESGTTIASEAGGKVTERDIESAENGRKNLHERTKALAAEHKISYGEAMLLAEQEVGA